MGSLASQIIANVLWQSRAHKKTAPKRGYFGGR